jgi:hypothetical protein
MLHNIRFLCTNCCGLFNSTFFLNCENEISTQAQIYKYIYFSLNERLHGHNRDKSDCADSSNRSHQKTTANETNFGPVARAEP